MTKCQAAWKLQALLTVTLWRTKQLPSTECSPSAATPSGSLPPQDLWCHKCNMKILVQRRAAHLKSPDLRNLPCQHQHARIPGRKNMCTSCSQSYMHMQTIPSFTQKSDQGLTYHSYDQKRLTVPVYTIRLQLHEDASQKNRKTANKTTSRRNINTQSLLDQKQLRCGLISSVLISFHLQVSLWLKTQQKMPESSRFLDLSGIQAWDYTSSDSSIVLQLEPKSCHTSASQSAACLAQRRNSPQSPRRTMLRSLCLLLPAIPHRLKGWNKHPHSSTLPFCSCLISKWSQFCSIYLDVQPIIEVPHAQSCPHSPRWSLHAYP